ncbi:hypothetical protein ABZ639_30435 [Saccharomonospora sp. NPDC006951]
MTSPMDAANTQQIPRSLVRRIDGELDPDTTTKLSAAFIESNDGHFTESHLAASAPTSRMDPHPPTQPLQAQPLQAEQAQPDRTQPLRIQADQTQPVQSQPQAAEPEQTELTGLVPTTRTFHGHSDFARRLEGL